MTPTEIEIVYEALARKLDSVGPDKRELLLAKLALLMAHDLADPERVCSRIEEAAMRLDL